MSLMKRFYSDPYMQLKITGINLIISIAISVASFNLHEHNFYHFSYASWQLALIPLGIYLGGVSTVFIHNASHSSFIWRWLNELCGHVAGTHQLWGFKGWQLIHLVHHQYVDNDEMDPHKHSDLTFWQFLKEMPFRSNAKIRERYREHWGQNARTQLLHARFFFSILSVMLVVGNLFMWFALCGPAVFLFLYLPSLLMNYLLVTDINYSAHPKDEKSGETHAVNLDESLYHRVANMIWSGIYYHANHHRKPMLYNPMHMPVRQMPLQQRTRELDQVT